MKTSTQTPRTRTKRMSFKDLKITMMMRLMNCDRKTARVEIARRFAARLENGEPAEALDEESRPGKRIIEPRRQTRFVSRFRHFEDFLDDPPL